MRGRSEPHGASRLATPPRASSLVDIPPYRRDEPSALPMLLALGALLLFLVLLALALVVALVIGSGAP